MRFFARGVDGEPTSPAPRSTSGQVPPDPSPVAPRATEAVREALVACESPLAACESLGRELALDGVSAAEALSGIHAAFMETVGTPPPFDAVRSLVVAWSETTLSAVNTISCEDPLTGLASRAHLRTLLDTSFRRHRAGGVHPRESHALVVVDLPELTGQAVDPFAVTLRVTTTGEVIRSVFGGDEVVVRVRRARLIALVERDDRLGRRVKVLRTLIPGALGPGASDVRIWIEGLPATESSCAFLVDELSRG
ncbi:hypothetical protein [Nocardioides yefusunii]|uniref:Uncharacterized protein n=1 Tax=Nocardioides yefusunii TaxID=2500546 RepID=A0ABW1QY92_9ACTN|nr:hypothetical protein [Nocardioides yefusunii]